MTRVCAVLGTLVLACSMATPAQAIPITEQTFVAVGGVVVVTFVSNEAGYTSELFLDGSPGDDVEGIFDDATTPVDATIILEPAGFEDLFGGGDSGYGSGDLDDLAVALTNVSSVDESGTDATTAASGSGESSSAGASPASIDVVDEPSSLMMFGFGLVALVFAMKRAKA